MSDELELAEIVRGACLRAALDAYESAGISGLCAEGRWEIAVQAIRILDLQPVLDTVGRSEGAPGVGEVLGGTCRPMDDGDDG